MQIGTHVHVTQLETHEIISRTLLNVKSLADFTTYNVHKTLFTLNYSILDRAV